MNKHLKGHRSVPQMTRIAAIISSSTFAAMLSMPAHAQATDNSTVSLDQVVVTASAVKRPALETSQSVTTVNSTLVQALNPQTPGEVLRLIPGMIGGFDSGPGGNSNISVRGLPITTGGSPFVQMQEDGLPTVLFGDMNFGNNDYWTKFDQGDTIQTVRGGAASTLASGAPGAIINFITPDGSKKGGFISLEEGVGQNSLTKMNFSAGGPLGEGLRGHVEGYLINGAGARDEGFNAQQGYQIKANMTKDLENQGFLRVDVKLLDDKEPLYTSYPALVSVSGNSATGIAPFPGFDSRTGSTVGVYNQSFRVYDSTSGTFKTVGADGLTSKAQAIGGHLHLNVADDVKVDDRFRYTVMSGDFSTQFMGLTPLSSVLGSTVNGQTVTAVKYAAGPNAGQTFNGQYLNAGTQIYTNMSDMGNVVNDLSFTKAFTVDHSRLTANGGLFYMNQHIAQDWHPNSQYSTLDGSNPVPLNLYAGSQLLTLNGVSGFNSAWGSGVDRAYNIQAADTAPYLNLTWDKGPLTVEAGLRHDQLHTTGWAESASSSTTQTQTINGATVTTMTLDPTTFEPLNYKASYNSYTLGGLYMLDDNTSAFARISRGGRFNVDRNILSGYTNPDGSLNASGQPLAVSMVQQQEVGLKRQGNLSGYGYNVAATVFHNTYGSSNFDLTKGVGGTYYNSAYKAIGLELEGGLHKGGFTLVGNMTYTDAQITANSQGPTPTTMVRSGVGNEPAGTPKIQWMLAPDYRWDAFDAGLVIVGVGRVSASSTNPFWLPAETQVSLHASWNFAKNASIGLNVHNLFDKQQFGGLLDQAGGVTGNTLSGYPGQYVGTVGAVNGRLTTLNLTYKF